LEACLFGRRGIGNDKSPDAFALTYAKTNPPRKSEFFRYLLDVKDRLKVGDASEAPETVKPYFERTTLGQILGIQEIIRSETGSQKKRTKKYDKAMFLQALMLGILHGRTQYTLSLPVPHSFAMSPAYVKKKVAETPRQFAAPKRDVVKCLRIKASYVFRDPIPDTFRKGLAFSMDATNFQFKDTIDMALFSPPYFDTHTYAWDNWLRLWFLGYDYKKVRLTLLQTDSEKTYLTHLHESLKRTYSLMADNTRCFLVVGDVKGHQPTAYLVRELLEKSSDVGFEVDRIINDTIDHKRKYLYGDNSHTGVLKDRIVELRKGNPPNPNGSSWQLTWQPILQQTAQSKTKD
jgi:hypothetical protein